MSLILDALRKLEREKRSPQRGFVVVGSTPPRTATHGALAGALAAAALLVPLTWWLASRSARPAEAPLPAPPPPSTEPSRVPPETDPAVLVQPSAPAGTTGPSAAVAASARAAAGALAPPAPRRSPSPAIPAPEWVLQAITRREGRPLALINDRLVREGDSLDGARVVRIGDSEVELEVAGRRLVLSF
jgi:hypothetical protein